MWWSHNRKRLWMMMTTTFWIVSHGFLHPRMMPHYYPLMELNQDIEKIHKVKVMGKNMVCYKNGNGTYIVHTDVCPHQGASLSKGWINEYGNLQCPYHGFEFCSGMFCKIPNPELGPPHFRSKIRMTVYPTRQENGMLFLSPISSQTLSPPDPFFPPEEYDESFRAVSGSTIIHRPYMMVCENLLDMLHISYVHSFGNAVSPLPHSIRYFPTGNVSGRTEFHYKPNDFTISNRIGKVSKVIVHNEYHLPTNTITRVIAGDVIKTVFTRSLPVHKNKTILYWKVYRNFWQDPYFPWFSRIGDWLLETLMKSTIQEDLDILKNVYPEFREGRLKTKYDVTIQKFRESVRDAILTSQDMYNNASHTDNRYLEAFHDVESF